MRSAPRLAARGLVVLAAVAVVALVARTEDREADCRAAAAQVFREITGSAAGSTVPAALRTLRSGDCPDSGPVVQAALNLAREGRVEEALPLARLVAREEPENYGAWLVLATALRERDPAGAAAARRRALALDPLAGE